MRKKLMDFLLAFLLFYGIVTALLYFNQRNMMYFPGGPRPAIQADIPPEIIRVTPQRGINLEGWYWPARKGFPIIVFFHGNGQAYQHWVNKLSVYRREGYGVLFTDYRGYGGFPGKPSEEGLYKDARSFLAALNTQKAIPFEDMIYYGESLGTGIAVQMATEFQPKALILESAYSSTVDVAKSRYWMFPVGLLLRDQYRSKDKIAALRIPQLFVHGEKDTIIPIRFGRALYEAASEPKHFQAIPGAGHNDLYDYGAPLHILSFLSNITAE